jgi:hypothetical protein
MSSICKYILLKEKGKRGVLLGHWVGRNMNMRTQECGVLRYQKEFSMILETQRSFMLYCPKSYFDCAYPPKMAVTSI